MYIIVHTIFLLAVKPRLSNFRVEDFGHYENLYNAKWVIFLKCHHFTTWNIWGLFLLYFWKIGLLSDAYKGQFDIFVVLRIFRLFSYIPTFCFSRCANENNGVFGCMCICAKCFRNLIFFHINSGYPNVLQLNWKYLSIIKMSFSLVNYNFDLL